MIVVANKMDMPNAEENLAKFVAEFGNRYKIIPMTTIIHEGVDVLLKAIVDKLVTFGGAAVLLIGLIIGGLFLYSHMNAEEESGFLNVGTQLAKIDVIGKSGLLAVSDAQKAALEAAKLEEEESSGYDEEDYNTDVAVKLSMSSIEKDLKIKFVNQDTGKLVGNVPFSIQVTDPSGSESLWSDDDMDGIIYKKNLKAGQYKVTVNAFEDEKYKKYELPTSGHKVAVKEEIEYKKVDVANEVKSESQVDVKKEDTKNNNSIVEEYMQDTVNGIMNFHKKKTDGVSLVLSKTDLTRICRSLAKKFRETAKIKRILMLMTYKM